MLCPKIDVTKPMHEPVLLNAAVDALSIRPGGCYVDGTFGRGGHTRAILDRLGPGGRVVALDRDPSAERAATELMSKDARLIFKRVSFSNLNNVLGEMGLVGSIDGVLLDLGVSSPQLDDAARGFSFKVAAPLDMRMDPTQGQSAADWLASAEEAEIAKVLWQYGEEPVSRRIARAIVVERTERPISDTRQLARLIEDAVPARVARGKRVHPATRSFQAIRIHINNELAEAEAVLPQAVESLCSGGRLAVISFHSLEDRIVKRYLRTEARPEKPALPMAPEPEPRLRLCGKAVKPNSDEINRNPRARSAVLRVAERTATDWVDHV